MTIVEHRFEAFFKELKELSISWCLVENAIRSYDAMAPSEKYSPLEIMCYFKGGRQLVDGQKFTEVTWSPGRLYRPRLIKDFFVHGKMLGLADPDTHAIFRATDNHISRMPGWDELTTPEQERLPGGEKEYNSRLIKHSRDYNIRQRLLEVCKPWFRFKRDGAHTIHK